MGVLKSNLNSSHIILPEVWGQGRECLKFVKWPH